MSEIVYDGQVVLHLNDYRGLSAYEIAVKNGFKGTEAEWLASLKGEPGRDAGTLTVNRKRAVDGNISVNGTDIPLRAGNTTTIAQVLTDLENNQKESLTSADIVDDLTSGGAMKVLSAEQGAALNRMKMSGFGLPVELPTFGWEGEGPYAQDIQIPGVLANEEKCHVIVSRLAAFSDAFIDCGVLPPLAQKDGVVTFQVRRVPTEPFSVGGLVLMTGVEEVGE